METKIEKIGVLVVDSGKMLFCDPLFLQHWQHRIPKRRYCYLPTQKIYEYGTDFTHFQAVLEEEKSVQELINEKKLMPILDEKDFSYATLLQQTTQEGFWQAFFENGKAGLALSVAVDDGVYEVQGEWENEKLKKIAIILDA